VSHHPRCVHARCAEQARLRAWELEGGRLPSVPLETVTSPELAERVMSGGGSGVVVDMTGSLAYLISLACPLECINGRCAHEPKQAGEVTAHG
jgi:hypothetical protein